MIQVLGQRDASRLRHGFVHMMASSAGGATTGLLLGVVAILMGKLPAGLVGFFSSTVLIVTICLQFLGTMAFLPERDIQVPSSWLAMSPWAYSSSYGFVLGMGFLTRMRQPMFYGLAAAVVAEAHLLAALSAAIAFGVVRGLIPIVSRALVAAGLNSVAFQVLLSRGSMKVVLRLSLCAMGILLLVRLLTI